MQLGGGGGGLSDEGQGWGIKCLSAVGLGMGGQKCKGDKVVWSIWARGKHVACVGGQEGWLGLNVINGTKVRRMQGGGLVCVCV